MDDLDLMQRKILSQAFSVLSLNDSGTRARNWPLPEAQVAFASVCYREGSPRRRGDQRDRRFPINFWDDDKGLDWPARRSHIRRVDAIQSDFDVPGPGGIAGPG